MKSGPEYRGIAKVLWNGRQAVRLRPRGKDWHAYFAAPSRGDLPAREDLPLEAPHTPEVSTSQRSPVALSR